MHGITTEYPNEAVQSSDPFPSIIHPACGDRDAGLLFSVRPRNPIYSHEQRNPMQTSGDSPESENKSWE